VSHASLHGVTIAWSCEGLAIDPMARVLGGEASSAATTTPSLAFSLRPASDDAARDPRDEGWEPSFFHGIVQAYRRGDDFLLWDRASRIRLGGGAVEGEIASQDREITKGSTGAMLEIALALGLRGLGLFHMHAAALALPSGERALVVGGSGAGKTTTTLALLEAGARYLGDDALFLVADARGVRAAAFPRAFHLGPATLSAFPRLAKLAGLPSGHHDKRPVDPREAFPDRRVASLSLDAGRVLAIFPSVARGRVTEIAELPRAEAFGLFLASSAALVIDGLPGREENLATLNALLAACRCYEIRLGEDALADPVGSVADRIAALR
jgi:hypothetical protein